MTYRLSPNEEAAILQQERERRRKLRIQQVREQERQFARKVRKDVRQRKAVELKVLAEQLHVTWQKEQQEKTETLRKVYERNLQSIGEGHRAAANQEPQGKKRAALALRNKRAAQQRHNVALDKLRDEEDKQKQKDYAHILSRLTALEVEKGRAAKIASLPPPVKESGEAVKPSQPVKCVEDFSTTHYHVPLEFVERAEPHEQGDAKAAAQEEEERLKEEQQTAERESNERKEKAILRHKHAHKRALLEQDMDRLMGELGQMEQADRRRRQAVVAKIPHQVFQPPHRRLEEREEQQVNLEQVFEDMYMANTEFTGDLTLALEPRVPEGDHDLDLTTESTGTDEPAITLQPLSFPRGTDDALGQEERFGPGGGDGTRPLGRSETLKRLMSRIQNQRHQWRDKSTQDLLSVGGLSSDTQHRKAPRHPTGVDKSPTPSTEAESRSESATTLTSSSAGGSRAAKDKSSELSEHPMNNDDNGTAPSESLEGGSLTNEARSEPIVSGSGALMHPMEQAAMLRSTKIPDMHQLKKDQQQLMQKEEQQRQRLAQQQLDSHTEQQKHLQTLQRNLQERQQALDRQIKQQSMAQRYNAEDQVQGSSKPSSELTTHHPEVEPGVQGIRHQTQPSSGGFERDLQQRHQVATKYQQPSLNLQHSVPVDILSEQDIRHKTPASSGGLERDLQQRHYQEPSSTLQHSVPVDVLSEQPNQQATHERRDEPPVVQPQDNFSHLSIPPGGQVTRPSQDAPVSHPNRAPDNVIPEQHTTGGISSQQQRIRNYQIQLVAQRHQSRDTLLEAQARLQQRRMNLLKQYPELNLPNYSPYMSRQVDQEPNVIYSQAEKELGPVLVSSEQYRPASHSHPEFQRHQRVPSMHQPVEAVSKERGNATLYASLPQEQVVGSNLDNVPHASLPQERIETSNLDNAPVTLPTHLASSQASSLTAQAPAPQDIPMRRTPQQVPQSFHIPDQQQVPQLFHAPDQQQVSQLVQASDQPEQSLLHEEQSGSQQTKPVATISNEQTIFRDFLKQQSEKLEQKNKEYQERLKEKQEQLKEQIKRQMEQYKDHFIAQQQQATGAGRQETETSSANLPLFHTVPQTSDKDNLPYFNESPPRLQAGRVANTSEESQSQQELTTSSDGPAMHQTRDRPHELDTRSHHPPPLSRWAFTAQSEGIQPHELSTIIEVDTPRSERKSLFGTHPSYSPESDTSSQYQATGLGYHQEHRSHLESDNARDQDLLLEVQRDMSRVLEDAAAHAALLSPDQSGKHHSLSPQGLDVPSRPVTGPKSPVSASLQYQESLQRHLGNASMPTLSEQPFLYGLPNLTTQSTRLHDKSALDGNPDRSTNDPSTLLRYQDTKTAALVASFQGQRRPDIGSKVSISSRPIDYTRTQSDVSLPGNIEASIPVTGDFHRGVDSRVETSETGLTQDGVFSLYAHDVGRGVTSYPASKVVSTTSKPSTTFDLAPVSTLHTSSTYSKMPGPYSQSLTKEPVIQIFQPTVDNSSSTTSSTPGESFDDGQHFTPLSRRSFGSGSSSSSDDTPGKGKGVTVWRSPTKSAERGSLRRDILPEEGVVHFGVDKLARQGVSSDSEGSSPSRQFKDDSKQELSVGGKWRDILTGGPDGGDISMSNQSRVSLLSQHPLSSSSDHTGLELSGMQDATADRLSQGFPKTILKQSNYPQGYQSGSIHISSVPDLGNLHPENREVIGAELNEQGETSLAQYSIDSSPVQQVHSQDKVQSQLPFSSSQILSASQSANQSSKPKPTRHTSSSLSDSSPSQSHGRLVGSSFQPELSGHSLDPTYSGFLPSHTSSQITEAGEMQSGASISHSYREPSVGRLPSEMPHLSPSEVPPHLRSESQIPLVSGQQFVGRNPLVTSASRYSGEGSNMEFSQHSIDIEPSYQSVPNISAGSRIPFNQSHLRLDLAKDSLSSIEEPRSQVDIENVNMPLMPLFSDVSISQQSLSFESDRGQGPSAQGQGSSEIRDPTVTLSDRYSLPWPHWDERTPGQQPRHSTEGPPTMFQSWQVERSEFMGQTSMDSAENQFQPLHEVTSSTQPGDEHTGSVETGILEEPDLTLVSLNTTQCSTLPDSVQQEQWEPQSDGDIVTSQSDFVEAEITEDQSGLEGKENIEPSDTSEGSALSLQEAFVRRKAGFIQASKTRQEDVKIRAKNQSATAFSTTVANTKKASRAQMITPKSATSSKSSTKTPKSTHGAKRDTPKETTSHAPSKGKRTKTKTVTRDDRKAAEKTMYQRTGRLYNQLEEVKQKKVEKDRKEQYATNRQKRKEFEQKLQNRLNKWAKHKDD